MIDKNCSTPEFVDPSEGFLGVSDKLSFRQIAALVAMYALIGRKIYLTEIANTAVEIADELITALEKKANDG